MNQIFLNRKNVKKLNTYPSVEEFRYFLEKPVTGFQSILYLNIPNMKNWVSKRQKKSSSLNFIFSITCFSDTLLDDFDNINHTEIHNLDGNVSLCLISIRSITLRNGER